MKKQNIAAMILGIAGGIPFSLGMVMTLMSEWNLFIPGVVVGAIGAIILLAIFPIHWYLSGKKMVKITLPLTISVVLGVIGVIGLAAGLVLFLTNNNIIQNPGLAIGAIVIGLIGIVALSICYPVYRIMVNKSPALNLE